MSITRYDVAVIGSGPAGESAAFSSIKKGLRTVVIEQRSEVGGNCTHLGTIPSKALRQAVRQLMQFNENPLYRSIGDIRRLSISEIMKVSRKVIAQQVDSRTRAYARNRVTIINGSASFVDESTLSVVGESGQVDLISAKHIIIATGSSPYRPIDISFNDSSVFDSDTILSLKQTPKRIVIYGAGVIGCEYASIFGGLGVSVDLIDPGDRILPFLDREISESLCYHFRSNNITLRLNESYEKIDASNDGVNISLKSGKTISSDCLLWCLGRQGNTQDLVLDNAGLTANSRGQLDVNERQQTSVDNIYAAGDVIGWPGLASASYQQGRLALEAVSGNTPSASCNNIPTGIYTIPEISSIGFSEEQLTASKVPYEVGRAFFNAMARAHISDEPTGMLKILFHRETLEILGVHCFGYQASEIIHIGQAIMSQKGEANSIRYFIDTTFNYPTMAEAYRIAALNGLNRAYEPST